MSRHPILATAKQHLLILSNKPTAKTEAFFVLCEAQIKEFVVRGHEAINDVSTVNEVYTYL